MGQNENSIRSSLLVSAQEYSIKLIFKTNTLRVAQRHEHSGLADNTRHYVLIIVSFSKNAAGSLLFDVHTF
jgi:hypothetical protein